MFGEMEHSLPSERAKQLSDTTLKRRNQEIRDFYFAGMMSKCYNIVKEVIIKVNKLAKRVGRRNMRK